MLKNFTSLFFHSIITLLFISYSTPASANGDTLKVLFVGNSITYFNDMPELFRAIAEEKGHPVAVSMYAPGGTGFVNHYTDPNVFQLFRTTIWDVVVLQPGSGESVGASFPVSTTIERGEILLDSIYRYSPCARVYLYQIPYGVQSASDYAIYFSVQTTIKNLVATMADSMNVQIIPAGEAARSYYNQHQNLLLHNAYGDIHPSLEGSFLTASTAYSAIFQDSIAPCSFTASLDATTSEQFFSIAENTVLNDLSEWRINTYNLHAGFTSSSSGNVVNFTNLASNSTHVLWDFGDGNVSTTPNPTHTYDSPGTYTVTLFAYNQFDCVATSVQTLQILTSGIAKIQQHQLIAYPNPTSDYLEIKSDQVIECIRLYNLQGELLLTSTSKRVSVMAFPPGIYLAEATINGLPERLFFTKN